MPIIKLVPCELEPRLLMPGDTGFLVSAKPKFQKTVARHSIKFLERYRKPYFEARCPELVPEKTETEEVEDVKMENDKVENGDQEEKSEEAEDQKADTDTEEKSEEPEEKLKKIELTEAAAYTDIKFSEREIVHESCSAFIASNLANPADFVHFVFSLMGQYESKDLKEMKPKFGMRIQPVNITCEARKRQAEASVLSIVEDFLGEDMSPQRFSVNCICSTGKEGGPIKIWEALSLVRNCVWAVNPNCVQCIKCQDFVVTIDILDPIFCAGVAKDFFTLRSYNTAAMPWKKQPHSDSEDDISDDLTLDEGENEKRILRIKRKRRAEKAGLDKHKAQAKKSQDDVDNENGEEEDDDDGVEEDGGQDVKIETEDN